MGLLSRMRTAVMLRSRQAKLDDFYRQLRGPCTVLDVGISNVDHNSAENLFLKTFRFPASLYTGLAVDDMDALRRLYPDMRFVEYDGRTFPFADQAFDAIFCNAVIEHVGSSADQQYFVAEMLRTGRRVCFTTPNRYFPLESHTNAIVLHWWPRLFRAWCRRCCSFWDESNLRLLSYRELDALMRQSGASRYRIQRNRLLGLTMTFSVYCQR